MPPMTQITSTIRASAYRDVRAGAFMHPLGATRDYELAGRVALSTDPAID
jgi:hypothetical protein